MAVTRDGPQNIILAQSLAEFQEAGNNTNIDVPDYYFRNVMAAGASPDDVQGASLAAFLASQYQQAQAGWTHPFVQIDTETNTKGFGATAGQLWNTNVQSLFLYLIVNLISAGGTRVLFSISGGNGYIAANGSGRFQLRNSGIATSSVDYTTTGEVPLIVEYMLGAPCGGRVGAGLYRLSTDREQISLPWELLPDDIKGIGGAGSFLPPIAKYGAIEARVGTKAERNSARGPKTFLQQRGWAVSGY